MPDNPVGGIVFDGFVIFVFSIILLNKIESPGKSYLIYILFYLLLRHSYAVIGYRQSLVLFINFNKN